MAKTKDNRFQNLTVDYQKLMGLNVSRRLELLDSREGRSLLSSFTPVELANAFPYVPGTDNRYGRKLQSLTTGGWQNRQTDDKGDKLGTGLKRDIGGTTRSDPGALAQLTNEQKDVFNLLKTGKIDIDDPRAAFLKNISVDDLKKFGIEKLTEDGGKQSYKMTQPDVTEEQIKMRLAGQDSAGLRNQSGRVISTANTNLSPQERALLDTIASGESPDYNTITSGGGKFDGYSDHPRKRVWSVNSDAAGRYQFLSSTWDGVVREYNRQNPQNPITDFSPQNQDKAALYLAKKDYARRTGRDLMSDINSNDPQIKDNIGSFLKQGLGGTGNNTTWQALQYKDAQYWTRLYGQNLGRNQEYLASAQAREDTPEARAKVAEELRNSLYGERERRLATYIAQSNQSQATVAVRGRTDSNLYVAGDSIGRGVAGATRANNLAVSGKRFTDPTLLGQLQNVPRGATVQIYGGTNDAAGGIVDPKLYAEQMARIKKLADENGFNVSIHGPAKSSKEWDKNSEQIDAIMRQSAQDSGLTYRSNRAFTADEADGVHFSPRAYGRIAQSNAGAAPTVTAEEVPSMPDGGDLNVDSNSLQVYQLDKNKLRRDDMIAFDGYGKPAFTMNSKEEMKFDPNTGAVEVNSGSRGYKNNPNEIGPEAQRSPEVIVQQNTTDQTQPVNPVMPTYTNSGEGYNSLDASVNATEKVFKSPSFERAVARSRFQNAGDSSLGGNFDFGAANMI